ncbi:hypothetical protein K431DRAFT_315174 [Polychaeton citri CBS 116435]|uniref:Protein HRI1 n=1 Tax=Polychaeton citri CBS 116435 TaxID=1314669 RepID=A0A9P4UMQ1_9PEZI|nr:hypothetical protein K431DRAFT_315174 [Polychaeton citri CBS 116435]
MAKISLSHRKWIRWLPEEASEPTTTLVLTSPEKRFVDLRVFKPPKGNDEIEDILPLARLDWAIGGHSESESRNATDGTVYTHSKWHHWVSSRVPNSEVEGVADEGDMVVQQDGTVLEKGSMVNPETGTVGDYEEVWFDEAAVGTTGKVKCIVLALQDDRHKERGMVIRAGQWCQAVLRTGDHVTLERWKWSDPSSSESGNNSSGWHRQVRIGDGFVPCGAAIEGSDAGRLKPGGEVTFKEQIWKVVELNEFVS